MKCLNVFAFFLVIIGALNWGLWGFFQFDFVAWLFQGNDTMLSRVIYSIIGLAGLWCLGCLCKCKMMCTSCTCGKSDCPECSSHKGHKGGGCCKMWWKSFSVGLQDSSENALWLFWKKKATRSFLYLELISGIQQQATPTPMILRGSMPLFLLRAKIFRPAGGPRKRKKRSF